MIGFGGVVGVLLRRVTGFCSYLLLSGADILLLFLGLFPALRRLNRIEVLAEER